MLVKEGVASVGELQQDVVDSVLLVLVIPLHFLDKVVQTCDRDQNHPHALNEIRQRVRS